MNYIFAFQKAGVFVSVTVVTLFEGKPGSLSIAVEH
jgi:hypothetical protein